MRVAVEISESDWAIATQGMEAHLQPSLGRGEPGRSCAELAVFGPSGIVWFETDVARAAYGGSVLYLGCFLRAWLRTRPGISELSDESIYQSPRLVLVRDADLVRLRLERGPRTDEIVAPIEAFAQAAEVFLRDVAEALAARSATIAVLGLLEHGD